MVATLEDVLRARAHDAVLADILSRMAARGVDGSGWIPESVPRGTVEVQADTIESYEELRQVVVEGGYLDDAEGVWLDLLAAGWFQEERSPARTTQIEILFTETTNQTEGRVPVGAIVVFGPELDDPLYYRLDAEVRVPKGGTAKGVFTAERPGARYNVAPGTITSLRTPIPGIAVSSPAIGSTGSILISTGADAESDESLRGKCKDKWGTLARGWMEETLRYFARTVLDKELRFFIASPGGLPFVTDMYLADIAGPVTAAEALAVRTYIADKVRRPSGNYPVRVYPASLLLVPLAITLYLDGSNPAALSEAQLRLSTLTERYPLGTLLRRSRIVDTIVDVERGVLGAELSPFVDIVPAAGQAIVLQPSWTTITTSV